jgi:hypothetical protein
MITNDCTICCERFNMSSRKSVKCPYCKIETCMICFKKYIMGLVSPTPDCMGCHKQLTLDFIRECTPKVFHNVEYRQARAHILLSQEKSLLPDTQNLVEHRKNQNMLDETIRNLLIQNRFFSKLKKKLSEEKKELDSKKKELDSKKKLSEEEKELLDSKKKELDRKKKEADNSIAENRNKIQENHYQYYNMKIETETKTRKQFIMGCPSKECRGFLSQSWKCELCKVYVCSKCRCLKKCRDDDTHICDPDTVSTINMMVNETRACPTCAVPIFKISGCPQMWCTSCHTTFCWKTGKIETGIVHNPHFYEWQRDRNNGVAPRVPGDNNECGIIPSYRSILSKNITYQDNYNIDHLDNMHRAIGHILDIVLPKYPLTIGQNDNSDLRVMFLMDTINEGQWVKLLQRRQKKAEKCHDIHQILDMLRTSLIDIFSVYMDHSINVLLEGETLKKYANKELKKIGVKYNNCTPIVTVEWDFK